jgi:hypothetical protein
LLGFAEALRDECGEKCGELGAAYLDRIVASGSRMSSFIHDLLAFSRHARGEWSSRDCP